ncbi:VPLPA-CTERM sorting domain-containing protein [Pseudotabrizicola sediminis]|nr:VPLPA-CTERM sorting domain-containing protein [Pseudotabrizicola sediminis]
MKAILAAAALAVTAAQADAAVYEFRFDSDISKFIANECEEAACGEESKIDVLIRVRLPSINNASFSADLHRDFTSNDDFLYSSLGLPYVYGYFNFSTDVDGKLTFIEAAFLSDSPDYIFTMDTATYGSGGYPWYEAQGSWSVSQVPLPASVLLLFGAIASLAGIRNRRKVVP